MSKIQRYMVRDSKMTEAITIMIFVLGIMFMGCGGEDLVRLEKFRTIQVGGKAPSFSGVSSVSGKEVGVNIPAGKFFIYYVRDDLVSVCLDEECGSSCRLVTKRGGHVIGGSDGKYARLFGVQIVSIDPLKFDTSLIVVGNSNGTIMSIYRNVDLSHLSRILDEIKRFAD